MHDLQAIVQACLDRNSEDEPLALATVVCVEGSAYRRPGARMLVYPDGRRIGSVSGGCLEADVVERARQVLATGEPRYVLYDTRTDSGDLFFELGCRGAVGVLIECASASSVLSSLEFLVAFRRERGQGALATVFRVEGDCGVSVGDRLMQHVPGAIQGDLGDPSLTAAVLADMSAALYYGRSQVKTYMLSTGTADVLIEPVRSPITLLLCGAGQDAIPLAQMGRLVGWQVAVVDHRAAMLAPERFPNVDTQLIARPEALQADLVLDDRTAAVIMTHNYGHDLDWLRHLLASSVSYIGLLGPRKRWAQLQTDLRQEGRTLCSDCLARLHSPTGLDIGSETPEEIALAIVAEIQAHFHDRSGGFLRDRIGPIHTPLEFTA